MNEPIMNIYSINNDFKLKAGINDATIETIKLLLMQYGTANIDKASLSLSDRTLQFVTPTDPQQIDLFLNDSFILTLNNAFEIALRNYYEHFKKYGLNFIERAEKKPWLDVVLVNCTPLSEQPDFLWVKDVCDYYRLTRNYLSHGDVRKQCTTLYDKLCSSDMPDTYSKHYLKPQKFDSLNYNDYKLFSRLTKDISRWICTNPIYDYNKILKNISINHFKQLCNDRERFISKIQNYIKKEFGITDINILNELTDKILDKLAC